MAKIDVLLKIELLLKIYKYLTNIKVVYPNDPEK